jgi:hypothetical protein
MTHYDYPRKSLLYFNSEDQIKIMSTLTLSQFIDESSDCRL